MSWKNLTMEQFELLESIYINQGFKSKYQAAKKNGKSFTPVNALQEKGLIEVDASSGNGDNRGDGYVTVTEDGLAIIKDFRNL